jgi:SAM-dependent methyltransferase
MEDFIEILPVTLLDQHRTTVIALKRLARSLGLEFGWHYLLDLTWMIHHLGPVKNRRILDAGAGTGVMQWYLADQGAQVLSVDRDSREYLPLRFRNRFRVRGLRPGDLAPPERMLRRYFRELRQLRSQPASKTNKSMRMPVKVITQARDLLSIAELRRAPGKVIIYNQDLKSLTDLAADSLDAIVAVSALEHNSPESLPVVVRELLRVLKPGGFLLATLGASPDKDWFHEPSKGWCYTDASLRSFFELSPGASSNYDRYAELFAALRGCAELRDNLAAFYSRSGDNGMPWGRWDPQYHPVGVCKVKPLNE